MFAYPYTDHSSFPSKCHWQFEFDLRLLVLQIGVVSRSLKNPVFLMKSKPSVSLYHLSFSSGFIKFATQDSQPWLLKKKCCIVIFTDRVRSTREGYVLTRVCPSVCLSTGGYPSQVWWGVPEVGYPPPPSRDGVPPARSNGGVPPARSRWGVPWPDPDRGVPWPGLMGGTRGGRDEVPPWQGWGTPWQGVSHPYYRTTDGVLDTSRSVCLLRSGRRTFLLPVWLTNLTSVL